MEELFCIGCGAQIQTLDKAVAGFTPQSALEKAWKQGNSTANVVSVCAITMRFQMSISQTMIS